MNIIKPVWIAKGQFDKICANSYTRLQWAGKIIAGQNPLWRDLEVTGDCGAFRNEQEFHEFKGRILKQVGARQGYLTNYLLPWHSAKNSYRFEGWGWDWRQFGPKCNVKYFVEIEQDGNSLVVDLGSVFA